MKINKALNNYVPLSLTTCCLINICKLPQISGTGKSDFRELIVIKFITILTTFFGAINVKSLKHCNESPPPVFLN